MFISAPEGDRLLVEEIIEGVGLRPVYVGENQETIIDALFQLWIALALKQRRGRRLALRLLEDCGTPTLVWGSLDSLAAEGSLQISVAAVASTYAHRVGPALRSPKLPRIPEGLATAAEWSLDGEAVVSDIALGGDFAGQQHEDVVFERCRISNAAFTGSELHRLRLTDVVVENADLSGADLDESSFNRVQFRDCRMSAVILTRCRFADVIITDCRLDQANLRMSEAKSVTFEDVDLSEGDFYGAVLENTRFFDCNLTGSEFSKASMEEVRFHGSNLLDLKGGQYLGGSTIETGQVLSVALGVLSALNIQVDDDREAAVKRR